MKAQSAGGDSALAVECQQAGMVLRVGRSLQLCSHNNRQAACCSAAACAACCSSSERLYSQQQAVLNAVQRT